jgi:hypothetical protein
MIEFAIIGCGRIAQRQKKILHKNGTKFKIGKILN